MTKYTYRKIKHFFHVILFERVDYTFSLTPRTQNILECSQIFSSLTAIRFQRKSLFRRWTRRSISSNEREHNTTKITNEIQKKSKNDGVITKKFRSGFFFDGNSSFDCATFCLAWQRHSPSFFAFRNWIQRGAFKQRSLGR